MDNKRPQNPNFNLTLARAYRTKKGYWSLDIGPEEFDALQKVQLGGRITLNEVPEESRKSDKSPHAYFTYMTKEQVKAFKERNKSRPSNKDSSEDI